MRSAVARLSRSLLAVAAGALVLVPAAGAATTPPSCADVDLQTAFNTPGTATFSCAGDDLTYAIATPPARGGLGALTGNSVGYAPNGGVQGEDAFEVTASNGAGQATFTVKVLVSGPFDLVPDPDDQLTGQDADTFWDLDAGETDTFTLACDPGKVALDGHPLVQTVDQGTGQPADVDVLESRRIDPRTYQFRLSNPTSGRTQGHLAVACISATTYKGHELDFRDGETGQLRWWGEDEAAQKSIALSCPAGWTAVAPGFRVSEGWAVPMISEATPDGSGWKFSFFTFGSATVDVWINCLSYTDTQRKVLLRSYRTSTVATVPSGDLLKRDTPLDCRVGFVGVVGGYVVDWNLRHLGQETQAKRRLFWVQSTWGDWPQSATFSLLCLGIVTDTTSSPIGAPGVPSPPVEGSSPVPGGSDGALLGRTLRLGRGGQVFATLSCLGTKDCAGTVAIVAGRTVLGTATYRLRAGRTAKVRVKLNAAGRRVVRRARGTRVVVRVAVGSTPAVRAALRG